MKQIKPLCDLNTCLLCRLCEKDWRLAINANRKNFQLKKGETLFREGDEMQGIFFVYKGIVKVHKRWDADKELIVRFANDGEIVGHRGLGKDVQFPVTGTALEPTTVCYIEKDFFFSSLRINHQFLFELMMFFAAELKESEKNMRDLAHMQVKGRIASSLISLKEKFGTDSDDAIRLTLSRQDFASFVGTSYETLFRLLTELSAEGAIKIVDKKIVILDRIKLLAYINHTAV